MITKTQRIRLGVFIVLGIVLAGAFLFFTIGRDMFEKNDIYYVAYTESVSGLNIGNPVKMRGVSIGKIEDLAFDKDDVGIIVVTISVRKGIQIKSDAVAVVEVFGITGIKFIDIVKGTNAAPALKPGARIPAGMSTIGMVTGKAEDITRKIEIALNNIIAFTENGKLDDVTRSFAEVGSLARNLNAVVYENRANLSTFTGSLAVQSTETFGRLNGILTRFDSTVADLNRTVNNKSLQKSMKNVETITDNIRDGFDQGQLGKTLGSVNKTLDNTNLTIQEFNKTISSSRDRLNSIMDRLDITTRNLADFTQRIKENPSLLIRKQEE